MTPLPRVVFKLLYEKILGNSGCFGYVECTIKDIFIKAVILLF